MIVGCKGDGRVSDIVDGTETCRSPSVTVVYSAGDYAISSIRKLNDGIRGDGHHG